MLNDDCSNTEVRAKHPGARMVGKVEVLLIIPSRGDFRPTTRPRRGSSMIVIDDEDITLLSAIPEGGLFLKRGIPRQHRNLRREAGGGATVTLEDDRLVAAAWKGDAREDLVATHVHLAASEMGNGDGKGERCGTRAGHETTPVKVGITLRSAAGGAQ